MYPLSFLFLWRTVTNITRVCVCHTYTNTPNMCIIFVLHRNTKKKKNSNIYGLVGKELFF